MGLKSLGYVGVVSDKQEDWNRFATGLLGMQCVDTARNVQAFRMDDHRQRLIVSSGSDNGLGFLGFEADSAAALAQLATRLENHHVQVHRGSRALADERFVGELICFRDPLGNNIEVFCDPMILTEPFVPGRPISGFRTGSLGMGHAVLHVTDVEAALPFYRDILGFKVSDYGVTPYKLYFFHLNNRHHNLAMVGTGRNGLHHFMVELNSLDDVGQGLDLAQLEDGSIAYTLGRHTNDHMTSFYVNSPSGFFVEYGWGGRNIDPQTWIPHETFDGPSFWGHERLNLPPDERKRLRDMRLLAAAKGLRAPIPNCAWLDSVASRATP
jgi:2,3-dihydroxybiphenyl 1,2-dioxygenase